MVLPFGIYGVLIAKRASRAKTVLVLGFSWWAIAGVDVFFLQRRPTSRPHAVAGGDALFVSEVRVALYMLLRCLRGWASM